ncbi:hypothetical protein QTH87_04790 [Variovorax sp. J22P168]|uniref:hypothetical protein n=1 Tax=Variovorax jilinensis TaxID=3053513 RepID=UPI0025766B59|nr:hypothetical protein [Variovorax sp. J22P168]MDM0011749.1 hypothetical protein [Variovorax sp. J22P168]
MAIRPIATPLAGERVIALSPENATDASTFWQRRLNLFAGRALSAGALAQRQAWQAGHIAQRGQDRVPGTVDGLEALLRGPAGATRFADVELRIGAGRGLAVTGEDAVLRQPLSTTLASVPVIAPPGFFVDGSGVGAPTADGSLNPRAIGAALGELPAAARATLPSVGVLLLQPALADTSAFDPQDPCERSACDEGATGDPSVFEDWRIGDAVRLLWYVWPSEWRALPAPGAGMRNALAWTVFEAEAQLPAAGALPWEGWGVPVALVQLDLATEQPLWVDRASVVRRGGLARNARLQLASGTEGAPLLVASSRLPSLQQARIEQFAEEVAALSAVEALPPEQLAQSFTDFLPPMGLLPRNCYEPVTRHSGFFPAGFDIDAVPVPVEQLDIAVRANASLAPLDMRGPAESVRLLVPVPLASWEPRLLITDEKPDAEFQRTLDRFLLTRARTLGLRQGLRVRQSVLAHGLDGRAADVVAWDDDDDAVEAEFLSPWGPPPAGGGHRSRLMPGVHQHFFDRATDVLVPRGEPLFAWVHLDPDNPPRTLMLQWHVAGGDWEHRAYWGENLIGFGADGTQARRRMGELPPAGGWLRIEVPSADLGLADATIDGMAFTLFDGRAAWSTAGSGSAGKERAWFGNLLPAGAQAFGEDGWEMLADNDLWTPFEPALGVLPATPEKPTFDSGAHADAPAQGLHFHSYDIALAPTPRPPAFAVQAAESLYAWVYLDPNDPPRQILLQWRVRDGNIARRAFWGWDRISVPSSADTHPGVHAGSLPQPGRWARLSVPLAALDLPNGASFTALDFMQFDGFAVFGPSGALTADATGVPSTERPWITVADAAGGGPTTNPGWNLLTAAQLRAPTAASTSGRVAALDDLFVHPALQVLSTNERLQLYLLGVEGFAAYLKSRTDRADDLVDYGFVKVQTDVYRVRQLMLGTTAATRLAVSPVLATIAQAETATASQEQISSFIADLRKKVVVTTPPPAPAAPVRAVSRAAAATAIGARAGSSLRLSPLSTRIDTGVISVGGSVGTRIGSGVIGTTLGDTASVKVPISTGLAGSLAGSVAGSVAGSRAELLDKRTLGDIKVIGVGGGKAVPAPPSPTDVSNAEPLTGSAFIRTTTIAKRLEDPKSKEARDYATSSRYEAVLSLVRLADTLTAEDGGVTPGLFEDVSMRGLEGDTFLDDLATPEGGLKPLERPFTDFLLKRPLLGALLKVPTRLPAGQTTGDPDEGAMFSDSTDLSDHVVALMRKMEGRIKLYRDAIAVCNAAATGVRSAFGAVGTRLVAVADELAEARHDVSVARSLLAEETGRLDAVNANRIRVLADEVKFLAFVRPREVENLLATPTHSIDPGLLEAPVPACLREHPDVPDEIADMMRVVREAPATWFVGAPPILRRLDRSEPLLRMVQVAKVRALSGLATPIVAASAGLTKISQAIAGVATRQVQALAPRIAAMQTLDLGALSGLTWQGQRVQAEQVVSFADLADGGHGRADVARAAATELENIRSIVVCLHAEFSALLPALRLQWAETLSEFDAAPNLRNLASLPRWSGIGFEDRRQMQAYVDWLFGQIEPGKPEAVALVNDVVRMCLLLASHAPVDRIVTGRLARPMPAVVVGTRIPLLAIDFSKLRVGMQAVAYRGEQVVARALVEDIGQAEVSARVVQTMAVQVELGTDVRVHFEDAAMLSLKAASATRTLFGR